MQSIYRFNLNRNFPHLDNTSYSLCLMVTGMYNSLSSLFLQPKMILIQRLDIFKALLSAVLSCPNCSFFISSFLKASSDLPTPKKTKNIISTLFPLELASSACLFLFLKSYQQRLHCLSLPPNFLLAVVIHNI